MKEGQYFRFDEKEIMWGSLFNLRCKVRLIKIIIQVLKIRKKRVGTYNYWLLYSLVSK